MKQTTHFGFKDVKVSEKQKMVRGVFDSVASKYDLMNDVLSFGAHHLWKEYTIKKSEVKSGDKILDIAGGTGDLARKFHSLGADVVLADINLEMLKVGRDNLINKGIVGVDMCLANAEQLPFKDNSFDIVSIAFGLRNVTNKQKALDEFYRVLKTGGTLLILEFSKTDIKLLAKFYDTYSFKVMPKMGKYIAGDEESYQYLAESIRKHPDQEALKKMVIASNFKRCEYHNLTGGIVALHKAIK